MIQTTNVVKHFGNFKALSDVTLHVPQGAIYGLVGPNGAGKSTLLRHLTGIYRPDSGNIVIDGEPVYENNNVKSKIAYIPDDIFYFFHANLLDMMHYYAKIYASFDQTLFHKLGEYFPTINPKQNIRKLSKGMQKQAAFWLAICCRPTVLILDEPVDGLDPVMRRQIWRLVLNETAAHQITVLVSSHNLRELEDVCDHVGIMHQGALKLEHSLIDLQENIIKIQVAFEHGIQGIEGKFDILHMSNTGRVYTLIVKEKPEAVTQQLSELKPLFIDVLPLTLEEIFIYEMGGMDYGFKEIFI
jgi:ABC-2 type transport system ATP-binding protein